MKLYYVQYGIGSSKYCVSYHNGIKVHKDGSPFYDTAIFKSKTIMNVFITRLKKEGYTER